MKAIETSVNKATWTEDGIMNALSKLIRPRQVRLSQASHLHERFVGADDDPLIVLTSKGGAHMHRLGDCGIAGVTDHNLEAINIACRAIIRRIDASLSRADIQQVVNKVSAFNRPLTEDEVQALAVATLKHEQLGALTGDDLNVLVDADPSGLSELSAVQISKLSGEALAKLPPAEIAALSDDQLTGLTSDQLGLLSEKAPSRLSEFSPDQIARLSPESLAELAPVEIEALASKLLTDQQRIRVRNALTLGQAGSVSVV